MRIQTILGTVFIASCFAATGCRKAAADPPAESATPETTVTEEGDNGTIAWDVATDGQVRGTVKATDGHAITKDITGTLTWPGDIGDQVRDVTLDDKGFLLASGPALEDDLTEIDYALVIEGKPWTGVLHIPRGGTRAIEEDAKASAALTVPAGKTGPNGGTVQYIGTTPVELVADKDSQEVRLYMLGPDYTVVEPGERTFRIGYAAEYPGMEVLVREPGATYYVGPWYAGYQPSRVTIAMTFGVETHVGIVGWRYGESLRFGVRAPTVVGFVGTRAWAPSVSVRAGVSFGVGFGFGMGVGMGMRERVGVGGVGVRGGERVRVAGHERDVGGRGHERGEHEGREHGDRDHGDRERGGHEREHDGHERGGHEREHGASHAAPAGGGHERGGGHAAPAARPSGGRGGGKHR